MKKNQNQEKQSSNKYSLKNMYSSFFLKYKQHNTNDRQIGNLFEHKPTLFHSTGFRTTASKLFQIFGSILNLRYKILHFGKSNEFFSQQIG